MNVGLMIQSNDPSLGMSLAIEKVNTLIEESHKKYLATKCEWPGFVITVPGCESELPLFHIDDLPREDTPCPCGDLEHWLVKYAFVQV